MTPIVNVCRSRGTTVVSGDDGTRRQQQQPTGQRIGIIGDAHGSKEWIEWMRKALGISDHVVTLGDYCDRGRFNLRVLGVLVEEVKNGRVTPGMGNHDLLFVQSMCGSDWAFHNWVINGGDTFLRNVGIEVDPSQDHMNRYDEVKRCKQLLAIAYWMMSNLKLYYLGPNGELCLHAGLPIDDSGILRINYRGFTSLFALDYALVDLKKELSNGRTKGDVFNFIQPFLWDRTLPELARRFGADAIISQIKSPGRRVEKIFFGHTQQESILNIEDRIFGIDRMAVAGEGGFVVNKPAGGGVHCDTIHEGPRTIGNEEKT